MRTCKRLTILSLLFGILLQAGCGGADDSTTTGAPGGGDTITPQPGSFPATSNISPTDTYDDTEVSIDTNGDSIIRTKIAILFKTTATVSEVNNLLTRINATITSSIKGARSVNVRIPDPGTVANLEIIITDIENESFVDAVFKEIVIKPRALPDNVTEESTADYLIIDNHLAVGGAAAWNAKEAITSTPSIIIMDWFGAGAGQLNTYLDANITGDVHTAAPKADDHGYHVAGIATASFGGNTSMPALVTGMFPDQSNLHLIDLSNNLSGSDGDALSLITAASIGGTVVMNTSIGFDCNATISAGGPCRDPVNAMKKGIMWADMVRAAGLETDLFHVTAASNRETPRYDARDTETQYPAATAATMTMSTENGVQIPNLTNTMVVENLYGSGSHPAKIRCLSQNSFVGGSISAIGENVTSLFQTGTGRIGGTSMATPQVAGLAAYLLSIDDSLTPQKIKEILLNTSQVVPSGTSPDCSGTAAPAIDAYSAVLALDKSSALSGSISDAPVRNAILDIAGDSPELGKNGRFDENDLTYFIEQIEVGSEEIRLGTPKVKYSRADLNGDGYNGGGSDSGGDDYKKKFNLNMNYPPVFSTVQQLVEGKLVDFDENSVTDNDILCYYAYSSLYTGDTAERKKLMSGRCLSGIVAVYFNHTYSINYPGASCSGDVADDIDETRETISTLDSFDKFINRPESHYWHSGDFDVDQALYNATNLSGSYSSSGSCADQSYYGHSELDSLISHSETGSKINLDVTAKAGSECHELQGDPLWRCSEASAVTTMQAHYDYKIKAQTTLKLAINLACTGPNVSPAGYPDPTNPFVSAPVDIMVNLLRIDPNGDGIPQHQDVSKWYLPKNYYCNDDNPVIDIAELIELDAPVNEGDIDRVIIMITINAGAIGNLGNTYGITIPPFPVPQPGELGQQTNQTTMSGFVEVVPAN